MHRKSSTACLITLFLSLLTLQLSVTALSATTPQFFVGMYAEYEFYGDITLDEQTVYEYASIINWTVLVLEKNQAKINREIKITQIEGTIPEAVSATFDPFPNASRTETYEPNLNESYWGLYLNDTANDLIHYKVGEKTIESKVGAIKCHHLQNHWGRQEWDTYYDENTGVLIDLKETVRIGRYIVTYSKRIIDTNAHLSAATDGKASDYTTLFILIAVVAIVIAIIVSASFLTFRRRKKSNLSVEEGTVKLVLYSNHRQ